MPNHVYTDLLKARSSYKEALKLFEALPVTTEKDERALAMKRAIFEKERPRIRGELHIAFSPEDSSRSLDSVQNVSSTN